MPKHFCFASLSRLCLLLFLISQCLIQLFLLSWLFFPCRNKLLLKSLSLLFLCLSSCLEQSSARLCREICIQLSAIRSFPKPLYLWETICKLEDRIFFTMLCLSDDTPSPAFEGQCQLRQRQKGGMWQEQVLWELPVSKPWDGVEQQDLLGPDKWFGVM